MRAFFSRRPIIATLGVWVLIFAIQGVGAAVFQAVAPQIPELIQRLLLLILLCVLTVALLFGLRYWREAGFVGPSRWRDMGLIWLPLLLSLSPLIGGVRPLDSGTISIFVVGYLLTGFFEESVYRGIFLGFLKSKGVWAGVLISSILFGSEHLTRLFFGSAPATVGWQVLFAFCQGVAFCALLLRTGTIWPLIFLHALWDFMLNTAHLPMMLYPVVYLTLLGYGVFLLRRGVTLTGEAARPESGATPAAAPQG